MCNICWKITTTSPRGCWAKPTKDILRLTVGEVRGICYKNCTVTFISIYRKLLYHIVSQWLCSLITYSSYNPDSYSEQIFSIVKLLEYMESTLCLSSSSMINFPYFRIDSLGPWRSHNFPSASEETPKDIGRLGQKQAVTHNVHNY